jgi:hypothetical protein
MVTYELSYVLILSFFLFHSPSILCPVPVAENATVSFPTTLMLQGSTKTGILGEIFLNLANFLNLVNPTAISMPLKRCNAGTVLQVS